MTNAKATVVIKLGTSSICDETSHEPRLSNLSKLVETSVRLRRDGYRVVIISSGGIAMGLRRLDRSAKPKQMAQIQAVAAVGQCRLIALWDELFKQLRQPIAQVLLTRYDIQDRTQYLNATNTLKELLNMGVIPIINENDTISVSEIRFGDNDTLSAITAGMVSAQYLFLMTDVDCLYTDNPRTNMDAKPIEVVENIADLQANVSSSGSGLGTGGMVTKLIAAELASSIGVTTIITNGSAPSNVISIITYLAAITEDTVFKDRQFWLYNGMTTRGTIMVDEGAYLALIRPERAGLLPVGVVDVIGNFSAQQVVEISVVQRNVPIIEQTPRTVGKALVNYSASEIRRIKGLQSNEIATALGYADSETIAHRDNMVFTPLVNTALPNANPEI